VIGSVLVPALPKALDSIGSADISNSSAEDEVPDLFLDIRNRPHIVGDGGCRGEHGWLCKLSWRVACGKPGWLSELAWRIACSEPGCEGGRCCDEPGWLCELSWRIA